MKRVLFAMVLGGILGAFDGLTAWFTPAVRPQLGSIVMGSSLKSVVAGFLIGLFACYVSERSAVILFGLGVGLLLAFGVAHMQGKYYLEIMLPGGIVGLIVGYATQKYGRSPQTA